MRISDCANECFQIAKDHGWWENERNIPTLLCLIHSEISEALEAHRHDDWANFKEELADALIRIFDMCAAFDIDIEHELRRKMDINKERPYRHGGKKC